MFYVLHSGEAERKIIGLNGPESLAKVVVD
jgi:hypothetical protein